MSRRRRKPAKWGDLAPIGSPPSTRKGEFLVHAIAAGSSIVPVAGGGLAELAHAILTRSCSDGGKSGMRALARPWTSCASVSRSSIPNIFGAE